MIRFKVTPHFSSTSGLRPSGTHYNHIVSFTWRCESSYGLALDPHVKLSGTITSTGEGLGVCSSVVLHKRLGLVGPLVVPSLPHAGTLSIADRLKAAE